MIGTLILPPKTVIVLTSLPSTNTVIFPVASSGKATTTLSFSLFLTSTEMLTSGFSKIMKTCDVTLLLNFELPM